MDDDAAERIIEDIDPRRGVKQQVEKNMAEKNDEKAYRSGKGLTTPQEQAIKDKISRSGGYKSHNWSNKQQSYVKDKNGNYRRVNQRRDVYIEDETGDVYVKTPRGTIKRVDKKYL